MGQGTLAWRRTWILVAQVLACSTDALANASEAEISATYAFLRDGELGYSFGPGGSIGCARRIGAWLAAGAELTLNTHHEDFAATGGGTYDFRYQSIQGGPRASPPTGRARPYLELFAGVTRLGIWERRLDKAGEWGPFQFSLQPGAGLDVFLTRRGALRVGGDFCLLFRHDDRFDIGHRAKLYRAQLGLAFHFGGP